MMISLINTFSLALLLLLLIMFISHLINGTAGDWISSKFQVKSSEEA